MNRFGLGIVLGAISIATLAYLIRRLLRGPLLPLRRVGKDLIVNGSFELGSPDRDFVTQLGFGDTRLTGWEIVVSGTQKIAWSFEENTGVIEAYDPPKGSRPGNRRFIDLTNGGAVPGPQGPYGAVQQTVVLTPGATYEVAFAVGATDGTGTGQRRSGDPVTVEVVVEMPGGPPPIVFQGPVPRPAKGYDWKEFTDRRFEASGQTGSGGGIPTNILVRAPRQSGPTPTQGSQLIAVDKVQLYRLSPFLRG